MNRAELAKQAMLYDELAKSAKNRANTFRGQLDAQAREEYAEQGMAPSWRLQGIGTVVLPVSTEQPYVSDLDKFLDWVKLNAPQQIELVPTVRPKFLAELLRDVRSADGAAVLVDTGEVIPGLDVRAGGSPGSLSIRPTSEARALIRQHADGILAAFEATLTEAEAS